MRILALLLFWCSVASAQAVLPTTINGLTYTTSGCSAGVPAVACLYGFTTKTMETTAFSAVNVDTGNTQVSGFQWYPFNGDATVPPGCSSAFSPCTVTDISFASGVAVLAGSNDAEMSTIAAKSALTDFVGTAFGGGGVFRVVMSFAVGSFSNSIAGIPAFWFQTAEYTWLKATSTCTLIELTGSLSPHCAAWPTTGTSAWGGAAANFNHQIEDDAMEYAGAQLGAALHESYGIFGSTCSGFCQLSTSSGQMPKYNIGSAVVSSLHTYDRVWMPATATTAGFTEYWFDGVKMNRSPTWTPFLETNVSPYVTTSYPPSVTCASLGGSGASNCLGTTSPAFRYGVMDVLHSVPILGCGSGGSTNGGCPMKISLFQVWQVNNLHNIVK